MKFGLPMHIETGTAAEANFRMAELKRRRRQQVLATMGTEVGQGAKTDGEHELDKNKGGKQKASEDGRNIDADTNAKLRHRQRDVDKLG